jgi:hypothetical protein
MKHFASPEFWDARERLPAEVQALADKSFALLKANPRHPSLQLKRVGRLWSARVGRAHRALGRDVDGGLLWFWIGRHAEYDRIGK